jgi:tRNA 2-selenouridine synthase
MEPTNFIDIQQYFALKADYTVIDVRSPIEFVKGHLPGAYNVPLFSNEERAVVGTLYKQQGKELAIKKGLELVSPNLIQYVESTKALLKEDKVIVHCYRGGMRSKNFAWLLKIAGIDVKVLKGGYKQYRLAALEKFKQKHKYVVIGGATGSAKTDLLQSLKTAKQQIIDLEGIANHKGSSFGSINEDKQPTQQNFENMLFEELCALNPNQSIYIEDESYSIGRIGIPYALWLQMKQAPILKLNVPFENRVQQLLKDYTTKDIELLKAAMFRIKDQLGLSNYKIAIQYLDAQNLDEAARMALAYYDRTYTFGHDKRFCKNIYEIQINQIEIQAITQSVLKFYNENEEKIWNETSLWQKQLNLQNIAKAQDAAVK